MNRLALISALAMGLLAGRADAQALAQQTLPINISTVDLNTGNPWGSATPYLQGNCNLVNQGPP